MNALGAADVRHAEARNSGDGAEAVDLLLDGHEGEEIVDALSLGETGIVEGVVLKMPLIDLGHHALALGEGGNDERKSAKRNSEMKFHLEASSLSMPVKIPNRNTGTF